MISDGKLICRPGQRATVVRQIPTASPEAKRDQAWTIGRVVRVTRLLSPRENLLLYKGWPAWEIETPLVGPDGFVYIGVYDCCLAPLPDEGDVFEFDHEANLIEEQERELAHATD